MSQNLTELHIAKLSELFEGFSLFGRCGEGVIDFQNNVFHIYSELVESMLHCVVHNMSMPVPLQQIFLLFP